VNAGWLQRLAPPLLTFVAGVGALELLLRWLDVAPIILPRPSAVWLAATGEAGTLLPALLQTLQSVLAGLAIATLAGITAAVAMASSVWVQRAFYPYAIFFQTVPIVAIAPVLVIWFGYGPRAVVAAAAVVAVFPVIANTLAGLLSVDGNLVDLFRLHGAGRIATLCKLRLPWALPYVFTGLRIAAGLAVIGAIVGEFVGGGGLGVVVLAAMRQQRTDLVFAAVGYASLLGLALFTLVGIGSRIALRHWHALEANR
jgi:NitT/TauT family transport system permease protein